MSAAKLAYPDQRFSWDVHWGGDFDLVDYVFGRVTFIGDYQGLLGSEFRPFDPYQSNYLLEAIGSYRFGQTEVLGVLNHVSRHLGDRFKPLAVAENSLGPRVMRKFTDDDKTFEFRGNLRKVIARAYVDYTWMADVDLIVKADCASESRRVRTELRPDHYCRQDDRRTRQPELAAESRPASASMASKATWSCLSAPSASSTPISWTGCLGAGLLSAFGCCGTDDPEIIDSCTSGPLAYSSSRS